MLLALTLGNTTGTNGIHFCQKYASLARTALPRRCRHYWKKTLRHRLNRALGNNRYQWHSFLSKICMWWWLGFELGTSCVTCTILTISSTHHLWWEERYFPFEVTLRWVPKALKVPVGVTNRYLRLIHRYRLMVPPGTNIKVTTRYLWWALGTGWCYQPVPTST